MSNPSNAGGGGRFFDRKRLDNSNFSQTCSLLSQFLKERRGLVDFNSDKAPIKKPRDELEKPKPPPSTANTANTSDDSRQQKDNLPKFVGFPPSGFSNNGINKGEFRRPATPEPATAQMTIFYAGKVVVYNDFPNDMAKEIIALADKGSRSAATTAAAHPATVEPNVVAKTQAPVPAAKKSSDLPIARRASLYRFLEKRNHRAVAIAPYQLNQQPEAGFKASGSSSANEPVPEPVPEPDQPEPEPEDDFLMHLDLNL